MSSRPSLVVVRDSALGDLLTALPALRGLRRAYPDHEIITTCPASLRPLAEWLRVADAFQSEVKSDRAIDPAAHPVVDRVILAGRWLTEVNPDVLVWLRVPEDPEPVRQLAASRPRRIIAYALPGFVPSERCPEFTFEDHILRRWSRLLATFDVPTDDEDLYLDRYLEHQFRRGCSLPPAEQGLTVIHPGAGGGSRHWPTERWALVASWLRQAGHKVVLTGSHSEADIAARVRSAANLPRDCDLTGRTDVLSLTAIVAGARLVLSTDTGPAHLAIAFRRPSVTLFGPVPPAWWGPPPGAALHVCLWRGTHGDPYAREADPGLLRISVEDVLHAVTGLNSAQPA